MRTRRFLALLALVTLCISGLPACTGGGYSVTAIFDDVGDLQPNGSVQVADVRVGHIGAIRLTPDFRAKITLSLDHGTRIPSRSQALVRTTSLLGEKFIELRPSGRPTAGPFFHGGERITNTAQAPELEFVAEQTITVLGAVTANDLATLIRTGAEGFGGKGGDLKALIADLSSISATFASRTQQITDIIDGLDRATTTLAAGAGDLDGLLKNLAATTQILAGNRQKAVDALAQLSRLAKVQNEVLDRYVGDIDRQIKQVDAIVAIAASKSAEVANLIDWLARFEIALPKVIPPSGVNADFTQVFMWAIPADQDPRVGP
ncbi:MAG: phospholipid/cholesterol/gamma-HCH transport system substrate-binding protein [Actinomycetota bacterium]|jgi:phospholipid/cholesterol/gamma-HCH transport system substrate-binding protein|nr:phospholipid/cholesterol/gamma-HCH transport system substrate-binding protein [Actinomycetota bacterium]